MEYLKEHKGEVKYSSIPDEKNDYGQGREYDDIDEDSGPENRQELYSSNAKYERFNQNDNYSRKSDLEDKDESVMDDPISFYGINKKLYKKVDNVELPKTGTDFVLIPQNPSFIRSNDPHESVFLPKQNILEECLRREAEKICFHETLMNRVLYDCVDPSFYTKTLNPKDFEMDALPFYIPTSKDDVSLVFESRFESGNLRRAIQIYDYEYNLILKPDYFTRGHTQWYYFSVANTRKDKEYRFNIINMMKPDSLYNCGMKPLVYSEKAAKYKKVGWHRDGYDICYYQNNMKRRNAGYYYTLTFSIKFKHDYDTVYFAHCFPYTYSDLCNYLKVVEEDPKRNTKIRRKPLCQTIAGNNCDMVLITSFANDISQIKEKKGIAITARVHPGETQSSFVMESIIDFLTGESPEAKTLRENFIIRIVPMLNPDGVINGNYRCNLAGCDLNRQWVDPSKKLHPTIFATKLMLRKMKEERDIVLFCDIHGHSRKKNIFIYGCSGKDTKRRELCFPLLYRNNLDFFSFKDSSFVIQKDRETTARVDSLKRFKFKVVLWRELNINNCYTLEISFCGADYGRYEYLHFNNEMFREIGNEFCVTILDLFDQDQSKVNKIQEEIELNYLKIQEVKKDDSNKNGGEYNIFSLLTISDQDSDYSNDDEGMKMENNANPQPNQAPSDTSVTSNNPNQSGYTPFVNQNVLVSSLPTQGTPLTVINELDDKKGKKKKKKTGK